MNVITALWVGLSSLPWLGVAVPVAREAVEWSRPEGGLRGRLVLGEEANVNGTRACLVYLELQNVSDVGSPMEIYFDYHAVRGEVFDPAGQGVGQSGAPANVITPLPFWIMLPNDSTLRLRVSVTGYVVPKDAGLSIGLASGHWLLSTALPGDYSLSASFLANPPGDKMHLHPWTGVLKLPKLPIPVRRP